MEFAAWFAFYKDSNWKSTQAQYVWSWSQTLLANQSGLARLDRAMESIFWIYLSVNMRNTQNMDSSLQSH
ncbi:UNVERIFIED_CONTAM: hypothetical protein Sindi_1850800 [Sesamum indicum]